MNHISALFCLLLNTVYLYGMYDDQELTNPLNKSSETMTKPIQIPTTVKKNNDKSRMIYLEISPSSNLWILGFHKNGSPEKRSPGTSLR